MANIFDQDFARNPWPVLRSLRDDGGVHRVETPDGPHAWLVTRFDDVRAGLLDDRLSTDLHYARGDDYRGFGVPAPLDVFQTSTPDVLARLRHSVAGELQPRRLRQWTDGVLARLLSQWNELDGLSEFDFIERVAVPLPAAVLGELLGLPEAERESLLTWANSTLNPGASPRARDTLTTMARILQGAMAFGQRESGETMLGRLSGAELSSEELTGLLFYLLFVWYEVLVDLIAGAVLEFSIDPTQREAFESTADRRGAVDELLRYLSPQVLASPRFAVSDMEIGGQRITAGETVLLCLASANHDDAAFDEPDILDLLRERQPHLGLGHGTHACLGTGLIHPIVGGVLEQIYRRWPNLRVRADTRNLPWRSGFRHRGPLTLPVSTK